MKIYLSCTSNLGDFLNALPVLSGIYKEWGDKEQIHFLMRPEMRKFKGIKEFLMYQDIFHKVDFLDDIFVYGDIIELSSWTREDKSNPNRPIETCRYENWLKDRYDRLTFEVDDNFILKVNPFEKLSVSRRPYIGDRWAKGVDERRPSWVLSHLKEQGDVMYLNYENTLMENAFCIFSSDRPFISTFTGASTIADLMNKKQIVLWGDDIRNWDNKPIEYSFEKHFYKNRNSKLMYVGDFELEKLDEYFTV
jgi:hypothetical protein